jgi:hypothetical protein
LALMAAALSTPAVGRAQVSGGSSSPSSGQLGPASGTVTTTFDAVVGADVGGTVASTNCTPGACSQYALTLQLPQPAAAYYKTHEARLTFKCAWNSPPPVKDDIDCLLFSPTGGQTGPGHPDTSTPGPNFEDVIVNDPEPGSWTLMVEGAVTVAPTIVTGTVSLSLGLIPVPPTLTRQPGDARFINYDFSLDPSQDGHQGSDADNRADAGEPSLGVDWATGKVMYMAGNQVTQLTYDTSKQPPAVSAHTVTPAISQANEDAILYTDRETNRTWALGLLLAGSYLSYSDDDGATWTHSVAFAPPAMPDHETLGAGPYHQPLPTQQAAQPYQHAVYYCAQDIAENAYCARSDDGGLHFNSPASPLWSGDGTNACSPIHGHVRVGPTGDVYVPNSSCTDDNSLPRSGLAFSQDNGQSFSISTPPDSSPGTSDPSVAEGPDGTVYFGYQAANGHPMIAVATHAADGTLQWRPHSIDVGQLRDPGETEDGLPYGVQNTEFSEVITGDPGRAAFAFLGTGTQGAYQDGAFNGVWYLFVSNTFDGGRTWRTVNATPNDPVQRGCVWNGGLVNACRNMLDFNDIGVDKQGHVYVAYTDGCTHTADYDCDHTPGAHGWNTLTAGDSNGCEGPGKTPPTTSTSTCTFARVSAIVRQTCGRGLVAASDPGFNESPDCATTASGGSVPVAPTVTGGVRAATALPNTSAGASRWPVGLGMLGLLGIGVAGSRRRRRGEG